MPTWRKEAARLDPLLGAVSGAGVPHRLLWLPARPICDRCRTPSSSALGAPTGCSTSTLEMAAHETIDSISGCRHARGGAARLGAGCDLRWRTTLVKRRSTYESRRLSRPEPAADDRGGRDQPPGAARGAAAHGLRRALPQRSAFYGGAVPDPDTGRARPRILGGRGGGR